MGKHYRGEILLLLVCGIHFKACAWTATTTRFAARFSSTVCTTHKSLTRTLRPHQTTTPDTETHTRRVDGRGRVWAILKRSARAHAHKYCSCVQSQHIFARKCRRNARTRTVLLWRANVGLHFNPIEQRNNRAYREWVRRKTRRDYAQSKRHKHG